MDLSLGWIVHARIAKGGACQTCKEGVLWDFPVLQ